MLISNTNPTYSQLVFLFLSISILAPFFILPKSHFQSLRLYGEPVPFLPGSNTLRYLPTSCLSCISCSCQTEQHKYSSSFCSASLPLAPHRLQKRTPPSSFPAIPSVSMKLFGYAIVFHPMHLVLILHGVPGPPVLFLAIISFKMKLDVVSGDTILVYLS